MKDSYERAWRERMADYAPAATDTDWQAMRDLLPPERPGGGWRKLAGGAVLLLLVVFAWVCLAPVGEHRIPAVPEIVDPVPVLPIPSAVYSLVGTSTASLASDRTWINRTQGRTVLAAFPTAPMADPSDTSTAKEQSTPMKIEHPRRIPRQVLPLPRTWLTALIRPYSPADSLLHRLPAVRPEDTSRSFYPQSLFAPKN